MSPEEMALAGLRPKALLAQHALGNQAVLRMRDPSRLKPLGGSGNVGSGLLQRKCACGGSEGGCEECKKKETSLHRHAGGGPEPSAVPPIVYDVLRSPGRPLDTAARGFFEDRFGINFSNVRVHTDTKAAESAIAVSSRAYTVGSHIVFAPGEYAPASPPGGHLLAHELTHVIQNGEPRFTSTDSLRIGSENDRSEVEAERVAERTLGGAGPAGSALAGNGNVVRRAVPAANVDCNPPAAAMVPVVGAAPLATLRAADTRAIELLTNAHDDLENTRNRILGGESPAWPTIGDRTSEGLKRIFRIDPEIAANWTAVGAGTIAVLARRLEIVRNLLQSGTIQYHCLVPTGAAVCGVGCGGPCCNPGDRADSCFGIFHNFLCNPFWTAEGAAGRTLVVMHEPFHMSFSFVGDVGRFGNAHCYVRLAYWLNGLDVPAVPNYRGRCPLV